MLYVQRNHTPCVKPLRKHEDGRVVTGELASPRYARIDCRLNMPVLQSDLRICRPKSIRAILLGY